MGGYALNEVEEAPHYEASDVEEAPKQYLPEVSQAVASVPKPTIPSALPSKPVLLSPQERTGTQMTAAPDDVGPQVRLGRMVPEAATPALTTANRVVQYPVRMGAAGAKAGGELGEGFAAGEPSSATRSGVPPTSAPSFSDVMSTARTERPIELGMAKGVGETVGGLLADPRNWPFLGAASARPILQRLMARGFAANMTVEAVTAAKQLYVNWDKLTPEQRAQYATQAGLGAIIAVDAARPKLGISASPEGTAVSGTVLGGEAGAGVAVTPEGVTVRGKIGPLEGSKTFSRGAKAGPALEPPTINAEPTRAEIAHYLEKAGGDPDKAQMLHRADQKAVQTSPAEAPKPAVEAKPAAATQEILPPEKVAPADLQKGPRPERFKPIEFAANEVEESKPKGVQSGNGSGKRNVLSKPSGSVGSEAGTTPAVNQSDVSSATSPAGTAGLRGTGVGGERTADQNRTPATAPLAKGDSVTLPDGRTGEVKYASPSDKSPVVTVTIGGKTQRFVGQKEVSTLTKAEADDVEKLKALQQPGEPRPGTVASDLATWQAPPELGVSNAPDYGKQARSDVEKQMGGALPRNEKPQTAGTVEGAKRDTEIMARLEKEHPDWSLSQRLQEAARIAHPEVKRERGTESSQATGESAVVSREGDTGADRAGKETAPAKYQHGSTQANIPSGSDAANALATARDRIAPSDLMGKGKETEAHVTVRYGIQSDDVEGVKKYLASLAPFEATLGKTDKFAPSEHSEGAAVIIAPIESPELHKINAELEKHGDFTEPSFKKYVPHATLAYVDPAKADRYVGMSVTQGKKFPIHEIAITDKHGAQQVVKLGGKAEPKFTVTKTDIVPTAEGSYEARPQGKEKQAPDLATHLSEKIAAGEMPKDNPALKKIVEAYDKKPAEPVRMKQAQEALEVAIVSHARSVVGEGAGPRETFDKLVKLYDSQPNMNVRTSTSIENQAYSTPAPLAYLADKLAGVGKNTRLYEPTAGNGMLTIGANPKNVRVNELNPERMAALQKQGFSEVTQRDAAEPWSAEHKAVLGKAYDAVVTNPPFGSVKDEHGFPTKVRVDGYKIGQIDQLISAKALDAMKDDGKATLILGASKFTAGGQSADDSIFLNWLYSHYNVSSHFEVEGRLYGRQGAAWPVRVITIDGRKESSAIAPAIGSIQRATTWPEVYDQFNKGMAAQSRPARERGTNDSLQRQPADESRSVRNDSGTTPERVDRGRSGASAADSIKRPGEPLRSVSDRNAEPAGGVAVADPSVRPDADVARSDQLEKGHKPESRAERTSESGADNGSSSPVSPKSNDFQTPYTPASSKKDANVLIPINMKSPLEQAMNVLEDAVGNIDKFVAKELGYKSLDELHDAFMGLQVDSIAAAIHQIRKGKAIVIADQTGIGKGRQAAAIIRWAANNGDIPVFITKAPSLFTDMYGDLADIGTDDVNPFIVNSDEWITRSDGSRAFTNKPGHRKLLEQIRNTGTLPADRNAVFLTYSQINVPNTQQQLLSSLARKAIFVLDESHNAGGSSNTGDFLRGLLGDAKGVTYLSATYAKRPDNMPLYFKTDMGEAIGDSGTLVQAMKDGGLPLQTVVSNDLVKAGQMFRRERSYDGISMKTKVDTEHRVEHAKIADGATSALRAIVDADHAFHTTYVEEAQKQAAKENKANKIVGGGNEAGKSVHHTEFSSVVHNFVRQMLLGIKATTAADDAIASLKRGEKPVIAVDNTMGSFLSAYVGDKGIRDGEPLEDFDYRTVLSRALDRSRYLQITNAQGDKTKKYVPLNELDPVTRRAYDNAQKTIDKLKIDLPVSPIDWIRQRIADAGYTVAEITGRNLSVDYADPDTPKLSHVPMQEQNDKVETIRRFNDGRLDSLVLNVAGSTGISAHASEKFKDQKPRHMIVAQPAQDINIFMQMLGRTNRTGQVKLPGYTILNADLPAEKRPTALLSKKMKSLNANTSSNTESATSVKAADMLNKYGDQIIGNYLGDNPHLAKMLHVTPLSDGGEPTEDIARKATGRLAILPVKVQEEFYRDVEQQYNDYIAYLDSTNQNELEPKTFDYDARETRSDELVAATNPDTPFGESAVYGEYSIKSQGKPLSPDEVTASIKEHLDGKTPVAHSKELIEKLDGELVYYKQSLDPDSPTLGQSEIVARTARDFIRDHEIGSTWRVEINGDIYNAAVTNIRSTHKSAGNPFALSKINVTLATNGSLRTLSVPATQLQRIEVTKLYDRPESIYRGTKAETRETAKIITGNLLAAYGELQDTRGTIINFSKQDGTTEQGILLPKRFDFSKNTKGDYRLRDASYALKFLKKSTNPRIEDMGIASRDGNVRVINDAGRLTIVTPKSKARGGKYFLDHGITDLTGDFVSQQNTMRVAIPKGKETPVIERIMRKSALYASPSMAEEAKSLGPKEAKPIEKPIESETTRVVPGARSVATGNETGTTSIQDLTDSISRQVSQKRPLKDRINQGAAIGESVGEAKDSLGRAYDRIKGAAGALWDAYRRPPKWTDYEDATGKWGGADQINALDLERFTNAIKRAVPDKLRREAISNWIEAAGDEGVLRERAEASVAKYKKGYEAALTLTDAEKTVARNVMNRNDATLAEAQKAGLLQQGVENYVRHVYSDSPKYQAKVAAEMNFASLNTKPSFTKERVLPTYFDAEQLGFTPKDKDVGYLTAIHERSFREALAARAYVRALMDGTATDGRPLVMTSWASAQVIPAEEGVRAATYFIRPNIKRGKEHADYLRVDHPALRGWKWAGNAGTSPVDKTVETDEGEEFTDSVDEPNNVFVQGDALVHPEIYRKLRNNLTKSAIRSYETEILGHVVHPGAFVLDASAEIKHAILSFSGFHQTTLAVHAAEHRTLPVGMSELDLNQPKQKKLVEHGLMVAQYDAEEAFGEGVASGGLPTKVPLIGPAYGRYTEYLFHSFLPRVKMGTALNALDRNLSRYEGKLSEDQIYAITAAQANASFGGLNYRMLGRNKTIQDVLRLGLMAPDFFEARARYAGQAAKPYGREQWVALVGGAVVLYTIGRILNEITDRDPHWDKPFSVVYRDKEYTMRTIQEDIFRAVTSPGKYFMARLNPLVSTAIHLGEGRNQFGRKEGIGEVLKETGKQEVPIPLQPWMRSSKDDNAQKAIETIAKMVGVNVKNAHEASEERLRQNEREGREVLKELEEAGKTGDVATVEKIENDPDKYRMLVEHEQWAGYLKELREIDSQIKDVRLATNLSQENKRAYLESLRGVRKELLKQSDEAASHK